jgi:hypothetical protein
MLTRIDFHKTKAPVNSNLSQSATNDDLLVEWNRLVNDSNLRTIKAILKILSSRVGNIKIKQQAKLWMRNCANKKGYWLLKKIQICVSDDDKGPVYIPMQQLVAKNSFEEPLYVRKRKQVVSVNEVDFTQKTRSNLTRHMVKLCVV